MELALANQAVEVRKSWARGAVQTLASIDWGMNLDHREVLRRAARLLAQNWGFEKGDADRWWADAIDAADRAAIDGSD
ncbi:MAG: hypothetical protein IMZ57_02240 [Acidobacteria bacterium]|nr:hypothetical protein [Acidobacteriota bacterium]